MFALSDVQSQNDYDLFIGGLIAAAADQIEAGVSLTDAFNQLEGVETHQAAGTVLRFCRMDLTTLDASEDIDEEIDQMDGETVAVVLGGTVLRCEVFAAIEPAYHLRDEYDWEEQGRTTLVMTPGGFRLAPATV